MVRTCTGCQSVDEKEKLLRVVRSERGVVVDPGQRMPGRGAYVHAELDCIERAVKRGGLARTLRAAVAGEFIDALAAAGNRAQGQETA